MTMSPEAPEPLAGPVSPIAAPGSGARPGHVLPATVPASALMAPPMTKLPSSFFNHPLPMLDGLIPHYDDSQRVGV